MTLIPTDRARASVLKEFDAFRSRLEPTEAQIKAISKSHLRIRSFLENSTDINVVDSFLTGSYARQTMIKPLKDIDFFIQVHYGAHRGDTSIQLLRKIVKVVRSAYPSTPIAISRPCVKVSFGYCHFEIVPAIGITGDDRKFKIPANVGTDWQYTYPKVPDEWMTEANKKAGGLFKPTIKMLKRWRDEKNIPLTSFHLEMLVKLAFEQYKINDYMDGVLAFFINTKALFDYQNTPFLRDPGSSTYLDRYLYADRHKLLVFKRKLEFHHKNAVKAFDYVRKGSAMSSKRLWNRIFGSSFHAPSTATIPPLSALSFPPNPPKGLFPERGGLFPPYLSR